MRFLMRCVVTRLTEEEGCIEGRIPAGIADVLRFDLIVHSTSKLGSTYWARCTNKAALDIANGLIGLEIRGGQADRAMMSNQISFDQCPRASFSRKVGPRTFGTDQRAINKIDSPDRSLP